MRDDILLPTATDDDDRVERAVPTGEQRGAAAVRPTSLDEFVGQQELKARLGIMLEAAQRRATPADHLLFAGPPGLGKTTLAAIVANELDVEMHTASGPTLDRAGDLAAILTKVGPGDVLFIDEIHRLSRTVEEVLYPAIEDFQLDIVLGKGPAARSIRLDLPAFTLIGATTRTGLITGPLRDRFGLVARLDYYDTADLEAIVFRAARLSGAEISPDGAREIARRSRGTPRIANRLLRRVHDYADVKGDGTIDADIARAGLAVFGVDELGLDKVDRSLLGALCSLFGGGPVGLSTLAIAVSEPTETVEDVYEPFLIQQGLLIRTPRGRVATPAAFEHLGLQQPPQGVRADPSLFDSAAGDTDPAGSSPEQARSADPGPQTTSRPESGPR